MHPEIQEARGNKRTGDGCILEFGVGEPGRPVPGGVTPGAACPVFPPPPARSAEAKLTHRAAEQPWHWAGAAVRGQK